MKTTLSAALVALSLLGLAPAYAGEGNYDPFPFQVPGQTTVTSGYVAHDAGSNAYPDLAGRPSQTMVAGDTDVLPASGSEGAVQTANSLPRGSWDDTVAYAQAQQVQRYLAQQAAAPSRSLQARNGRRSG